MKHPILAVAVIMAWLLVPNETHAQCPAQENLVYYNYNGSFFSLDLLTQEEDTILLGPMTSIDGVPLVIGSANINGDIVYFNALAANPEAGDLVYFANGTSVFGLTPSTADTFHISDLSVDFPTTFMGQKLESGGGSFYNGHYYLGSDCDGVYELAMSADGMSITSISKVTSVQSQFGDLIVVPEGCSSSNPTLYVSGGSSNSTEPCASATNQQVGVYAIDLVTNSVTQIRTGALGQLAVTANGRIFKGSGASGVQEYDPCTDSFIGAPAFNVMSASGVNDMTGPGICPQPAELILVPDFDTIPGYNTVTIDVAGNDPVSAVASTIMITKNGANGTATLSGTTISYVPTFGFTGYDTICYQMCTTMATNCDTTIAVFAIGDDHDMDGLLDIHECPSWDLDIASCDIDGDNLPNIYDVDSDNDSILDEIECPAYNGMLGSCNSDTDGLPDYEDVDSDDDGLDDRLECGGWTGTGCDMDGDGMPNFRDLDSDDDTFLDGTFTEFPTEDCDTDGTSDYLDPDPCDICIPEGFSPNGDGRNDVFEIVGLQAFPNNRLKVFNRWGEEVYDQPNYQNNWVGDNQGKQEVLKGDLLPVGTYYVIFEYESLGSMRTYEGICYIQY